MGKWEEKKRWEKSREERTREKKIYEVKERHAHSWFLRDLMGVVRVFHQLLYTPLGSSVVDATRGSKKLWSYYIFLAGGWSLRITRRGVHEWSVHRAVSLAFLWYCWSGFKEGIPTLTEIISFRCQASQSASSSLPELVKSPPCLFKIR